MVEVAVHRQAQQMDAFQVNGLRKLFATCAHTLQKRVKRPIHRRETLLVIAKITVTQRVALHTIMVERHASIHNFARMLQRMQREYGIFHIAAQNVIER